jgi:hypothetical protein
VEESPGIAAGKNRSDSEVMQRRKKHEGNKKDIWIEQIQGCKIFEERRIGCNNKIATENRNFFK